VREVFVRALEEAAQHGQVEALAEAPRPGQEQHMDAWLVEDVAHEPGLVDVGEPALAEHAKVVDAEGNAQGHGREGRHVTARARCQALQPRAALSGAPAARKRGTPERDAAMPGASATPERASRAGES
jgi:hypothetical protein